MLAIVALAALTGSAFPFRPTQDALNSFLTAGLPPLALAVWAMSGRPPQHILRAVGRFVLPAAALAALAGAGVYLYYLRQVHIDVETARAALTTTVICCGAALILFARPPARFWSATTSPGKDRRPAALALSVPALLAVIMAIPALRAFFDLTLLAAEDYALIAVVVAAWAVVLRLLYTVTGSVSPG